MGKKYYCDYCDKAFADNPTNRKNHARGVHHRQAMSSHYEHFKEPETQLREDSGKRPCRTLATQGHCPFGGSCRFSHMTDERRHQLEKLVHAQQESKKRKQEAKSQSVENFDVDEWVAKRLKSNDTDTGATLTNQNEEKADSFPVYRVPDMFLNNTQVLLPPSLIPPTASAYQNFVSPMWGP